MALLVVDTESGSSFELAMPPDRLIALARQLARSEEVGHRDGFRDHVATVVAQALNSRLDWDLLPPTEPQKSFAISISEGLGVEIPIEAQRFRGAMSEFLSTHADRLKALQLLRASVKSAPLPPAELRDKPPLHDPPEYRYGSFE